MCSDPYMPNTLEQLAMDTRARLERIDKDLSRKSPQELDQVTSEGEVLFESVHGVNW
jgi:hypothetical protein